MKRFENRIEGVACGTRFYILISARKFALSFTANYERCELCSGNVKLEDLAQSVYGGGQ